MSGAIISYENELLPAMGKRSGILRPDATGYRTINLGGINLTNSAGQFYDSPQQVINLFTQSSNLQRRIRSGRLYSELGHPKIDGLTDDQFLVRVLSLYEEKECAHIRKIELVDGRDENGRPALIIVGEVKPSGPHAAVLENKFNNGFEDTCFSIRCMTDVRRDFGRVIKTITEIVTWDYVGEPGIAIASKYRSPSTESGLVLPSSAYEFSEEALLKAHTSLTNMQVGLESGGAVEMLSRMIDRRQARRAKSTLPASQKWIK